MERLQSHQGPDASANQDFVTNVVFQDVGKLLGIACRFVGKKAELMPRVSLVWPRKAQRRRHKGHP